ncbi:MAG: hypothetical protein LBK60_08320 [Verrucomicrobiales bacterium]|jgi:hypothetical protein|nr:hypothetical protein [Verrucomicrobiales bacterium]
MTARWNRAGVPGVTNNYIRITNTSQLNRIAFTGYASGATFGSTATSLNTNSGGNVPRILISVGGFVTLGNVVRLAAQYA